MSDTVLVICDHELEQGSQKDVDESVARAKISNSKSFDLPCEDDVIGRRRHLSRGSGFWVVGAREDA